VEHDGMNVPVLGARVIGFAVAQEAVKNFLYACFSAQGRYLRRLQKLAALEKRFLRSLQREWQ
jgi:ribose 5-phosphate isomerase B